MGEGVRLPAVQGMWRSCPAQAGVEGGPALNSLGDPEALVVLAAQTGGGMGALQAQLETLWPFGPRAAGSTGPGGSGPKSPSQGLWPDSPIRPHWHLPLGVLPWRSSWLCHRCRPSARQRAPDQVPPASSLQPAASPSGHFLFFLSTSLHALDRHLELGGPARGWG